MSRSHKRTIWETWGILPEQIDLSTWPEAFVESLSDSNREIFSKRKIAVELFLQENMPLTEIEKITKVKRQYLYTFVRRCVSIHSDGRVWGYRALLPAIRVKTYERINDKTSGAGSFQAFLDKNLNLKEEVESLYLHRRKGGISEISMQIKHIHERFVRMCIKNGITLDDYPLKNKDRGKRSLERYLTKIGQKNMVAETRRYGSEAFRHIRVTGTHDSYKGPDTRPYSRVQFDGHRIDAIFTITFTTIDGDIRTEVCPRPQLLVIEDIATRAILGYHLCINPEYSAIDVLKCIQNAIVPWKEKTFSIPGLKYRDGAGFPSGKIPQAEWAVWDELSYDNGRANLAKIVTDRLIKNVGCSLNPGPVATPERRPFIERLFKILEDNGYHRLPNTTGSGTRDPKRNDPEASARRYAISYETLKDFTEILLASYNATPHGALYGATPLEVMKNRIEKIDALPLRILPEAVRDEIKILRLSDTRKVRGGSKSGTRPYINFENVRYTNEVLSSSRQFNNTTLTLQFDPDDLRHIKAFLPNGAEIGFLRAKGKW